MQQALTANRIVIRNKTITTAIAIVAAVALPQIFHAVGAVSGLGSALGETFLPMQLPVLLAGLLAGPFAGVIAAILSPLISFAISGMPGQAMLPYIMAELIGYGLVAGVLSKTKMPVIGKSMAARPDPSKLYINRGRRKIGGL